jgi:hypothetical protein
MIPLEQQRAELHITHHGIWAIFKSKSTYTGSFWLAQRVIHGRERNLQARAVAVV